MKQGSEVKSAVKQEDEKLVLLDQVRGALAELRGIVLPNTSVEKAIRDTLDNLGHARPNAEIIHKDANALAVEVTRNIGQRGVVALDSQTFGHELKKLDGAFVPVSRARFFPIHSIGGMGPVTGRKKPLSVHRELIAKSFAGKEVVILDDMLVTGWTFTRLIPYFTEGGMKVCAIGVALSNRPDDTLIIDNSELPIYAGYKIPSRSDKSIFELKNFLALPGSGTAHFGGAIKDRNTIANVKKSLETFLRSGRDDTSLRRELFAMELDFEEGEILRKVSQIVGEEVSTLDLLDILRSIRLPNFKPDLVGSTRSLYIGDYHSPAWQMTKETWKEFSRRQLAASIRLYEDVRNNNGRAVTVGQLGIFDEFVVDKDMPVEKHLANLLKNME